MFTNSEIDVLRTTARNMAYGLFCDNKFVVCDPTNVEDIIEEAIRIMLKRWKKLGRTAGDLEDGYIYDLLSDAAERTCFIPKNRGPLFIAMSAMNFLVYLRKTLWQQPRDY